MGKEVGRRIKEPHAVTYDLYDKVMLDSHERKLPEVFPDTSLGLTVATVRRPATQHHDLLFYRFGHMETPVGMITHGGDSMTLLTYEINRVGTRFNITEEDVQERLKEMLAR
ncbi:hypothetical protein D3C81_288060 [compost metagenome]